MLSALYLPTQHPVNVLADSNLTQMQLLDVPLVLRILIAQVVRPVFQIYVLQHAVQTLIVLIMNPAKVGNVKR